MVPKSRECCQGNIHVRQSDQDHVAASALGKVVEDALNVFVLLHLID